jgi:hypothetical protein
MKNAMFLLFAVTCVSSLVGCRNKNVYPIFSVPFSKEIKNKFFFRIEDQITNEEIIIHGNDIRKMRFDVNVFEKPEVIIHFTRSGSRKSSKLTMNNVGKPMYIYFDDTLFVSPIISGPVKNNATMNLGIEEVEFLISKGIFSSNDDLGIIEKWVEKWNSWETPYDE